MIPSRNYTSSNEVLTQLRASLKRRNVHNTIGGSQSPLSLSLRDEIYDLVTVDDRSLAWLIRFYKGTFDAREVRAAVDTLLSLGRLEAYPDRCGGRILFLPISGEVRQ